jgi:hypothetical protein
MIPSGYLTGITRGVLLSFPCLVFLLYLFIYWIKKTCFSTEMPFWPCGGIGPIYARWTWPAALRKAKSLPLFRLCVKGP